MTDQPEGPSAEAMAAAKDALFNEVNRLAAENATLRERIAELEQLLDLASTSQSSYKAKAERLESENAAREDAE